MELALSLVRSGSLPQARALYKQICQADKNNAEAWIMLGAIEAELGNLAEAISCQRRAVAQQPQSTIAHMHLANTFLRLGQLEDAQSSCQTALGLQPDLAAAWFLLARVHMQSGRNEEAESCCHKAITLKPGFPEAHFVLGKVLGPSISLFPGELDINGDKEYLFKNFRVVENSRGLAFFDKMGNEILLLEKEEEKN